MILLKSLNPFAVLIAAFILIAAGPALAESVRKMEAAIASIRALERPGRDLLATFWDGNKYVQCRRMADQTLRCEAGGSLMQPSLERVLTPERIGRLAGLGWTLDPSFGNYVHSFPPDVPANEIAGQILAALSQGYDADPAALELETGSIAHERCPPRHGPGQNLAGMIDDSPSMALVSIEGCSYKRVDNAPAHKLGPDSTVADLVKLYGPKVTAEIQRLTLNRNHRVFALFDTGLGYVQCEPVTQPDGLYCEAQSADTFPPLAAVLTPERIARLHAAGFADPGRAPNYAKTYPAEKLDEASMAGELLGLLHDAYGYYGASKLEIKTEEDD